MLNEVKHLTDREYFCLTIYLYELLPVETQDFWIHLFSKEPEVGISVLEKMNVHPRYLIRGNVKDILDALLGAYQGGKYKRALTELLASNDYGRDFKDTVNRITKVFDKEQ